MEIADSTLSDVTEIFRLYRHATELQKTKMCVTWPLFERHLIETEIRENRQWKLLLNGEIACIWATCFTDPLIWEERDEEPSVYIHRIATHPDYRGNNLVLHIVGWAKEYARTNGKQYIRLDTVGQNEALIAYYKRCGFAYLGLKKLKNTRQLPAHYHDASVALFEIKLSTPAKQGNNTANGD